MHPLSTSESHRARRQTREFPFQRNLAKRNAAALRQSGPTLPEGMRPRASSFNVGVASRKTANRGISVPTRFDERNRGRAASAGANFARGGAPCILFQRRNRIAQDGKLWNFRSDAIWRKEARPRCVGRGQLYRRGCASGYPLPTSNAGNIAMRAAKRGRPPDLIFAPTPAGRGARS